MMNCKRGIIFSNKTFLLVIAERILKKCSSVQPTKQHNVLNAMHQRKIENEGGGQRNFMAQRSQKTITSKNTHAEPKPNTKSDASYY